MGLFDLFGGSSPAAKVQKLKAKATQKYGDPQARQKALADLVELRSPEAIAVLLQRFTLTVDPLTTDADEKQSVFESLCDLKRDAVGPVSEFLRRSEQASSWALKILEAVLSEDELIGAITQELNHLAASYTRDTEKKEVLLHTLAGKNDARCGPAVVPFLGDHSDEVKISALNTLASLKYEPAREPVLELLVAEDTAKRVQLACIHALHEAALPVQGFREKVEGRLPPSHFVDRSGLIQKRGA